LLVFNYTEGCELLNHQGHRPVTEAPHKTRLACKVLDVLEISYPETGSAGLSVLFYKAPASDMKKKPLLIKIRKKSENTKPGFKTGIRPSCSPLQSSGKSGAQTYIAPVFSPL
jgi:hypothetical protein